MFKMYIALIAILFFIGLSSGERCHPIANTNTCKTWDKPFMYCDHESLECEEMEELTLSNAVITNMFTQPSMYCSRTQAGLGLLAIQSRCTQMMAIGCELSSGRVCSNRAVIEEGICTEREFEANEVIHRMRLLGEDCGSNTTQHNCGPNMFCSSQRQCVLGAGLGEPCGSIYGGCLDGLTCELGACRVRYNKAIGEHCERNDACVTDYCLHGICSNKLIATECHRDYECSQRVPNSVCIGATENRPGKCNHMLFSAQRDYHACFASRCKEAFGSSNYDRDCGVKKCETEFVKTQCSAFCSRLPDRRFNLNWEYNFDCEELKATPWSDLSAADRCQIGEQFQNCEAYAKYRNH